MALRPSARALTFYGVVSEPLQEAVELTRTREEAERMVADWNHDEPCRAGELHIEPIAFGFSLN